MSIPNDPIQNNPIHRGETPPLLENITTSEEQGLIKTSSGEHKVSKNVKTGLIGAAAVGLIGASVITGLALFPFIVVPVATVIILGTAGALAVGGALLLTAATVNYVAHRALNHMKKDPAPPKDPPFISEPKSLTDEEVQTEMDYPFEHEYAGIEVTHQVHKDLIRGVKALIVGNETHYLNEPGDPAWKAFSSKLAQFQGESPETLSHLTRFLHQGMIAGAVIEAGIKYEKPITQSGSINYAIKEEGKNFKILLFIPLNCFEGGGEKPKTFLWAATEYTLPKEEVRGGNIQNVTKVSVVAERSKINPSSNPEELHKEDTLPPNPELIEAFFKDVPQLAFYKPIPQEIINDFSTSPKFTVAGQDVDYTRGLEDEHVINILEATKNLVGSRAAAENLLLLAKPIKLKQAGGDHAFQIPEEEGESGISAAIKVVKNNVEMVLYMPMNDYSEGAKNPIWAVQHISIPLNALQSDNPLSEAIVTYSRVQRTPLPKMKKDAILVLPDRVRPHTFFDDVPAYRRLIQ